MRHQWTYTIYGRHTKAHYICTISGRCSLSSLPEEAQKLCASYYRWHLPSQEEQYEPPPQGQEMAMAWLETASNTEHLLRSEPTLGSLHNLLDLVLLFQTGSYVAQAVLIMTM